jgi:hypothetical protein
MPCPPSHVLLPCCSLWLHNSCFQQMCHNTVLLWLLWKWSLLHGSLTRQKEPVAWTTEFYEALSVSDCTAWLMNGNMKTIWKEVVVTS